MNETNHFLPAQIITTSMNWEDVVLETQVMEQASRLIEQPCFHALFLGPPGTGKTLIATLIGKSSDRDVYRVDLSMVVSKYIGETEKNLSLIFDGARIKNWILFFDEADALFGKRTGNTAANNRTSNKQVDFLLKEIVRYDGAVILASTLRANMDEAFVRLFDVMIQFSMPTTQERYQLWRRAFSDQYSLSPEIDVYEIAEKHELSGGAIINILRFCALTAIRRKDTVVTKEALIKGIKREYKNKGERIA